MPAAEVAPSSAPRSGTAGLASGGRASNAISRTGIPPPHRQGRNRRASTPPASRTARARGEAWMFWSRSNCAPAETRKACSAVSRALKAAAPSGAVMRTSTRSAPEPKPAITRGAKAVARLVPNWCRRAAVETTRPELSGRPPPGGSVLNWVAGMPVSRSCRHITGSHETVTPGLTCWAIHAAACARFAGPGCGGANGPGFPTPAAASTPPITIARAQSAPRVTVHRCLRLACPHRMARRRPNHGRTTSTARAS